MNIAETSERICPRRKNKTLYRNTHSEKRYHGSTFLVFIFFGGKGISRRILKWNVSQNAIYYAQLLYCFLSRKLLPLTFRVIIKRIQNWFLLCVSVPRQFNTSLGFQYDASISYLYIFSLSCKIALFIGYSPQESWFVCFNEVRK